MGDRGNIIVKDGNDAPVFLYSHWGGSELPATLQAGLARRLRWTDGSYLTRILFCEMIDGDVRGETGFGISTHQCDNEHNYLVVDVGEQRVRVLRYDYRERDKPPLESAQVAAYTFEEYCALDLESGNPWEAGEAEDDD